MGYWVDKNGRGLSVEEMDRMFNPFFGVEFIYSNGLIFLDQNHLMSYEALTPGDRHKDLEWAATVYMLTADRELRGKAVPHINPVARKIDWDVIISTDFGSGHYAAIYWAFGLWGGRSWGSWVDDDGKKVPIVDIVSRGYSMGSTLQFIALVAQAHRWGLNEKIPALAKVFADR